MTIDELNALNDGFDRQIQAIRVKRDALNVVRKKKIRIEQITARYKGKIRPEDFEFMKANGLLPKDTGTVVVPGVAEAKGAAVTPAG